MRLTACEIRALLSVAGDADAPAHVENYPTVKEGECVLAAFERGMNKLRRRLAEVERAKQANTEKAT